MATRTPSNDPASTAPKQRRSKQVSTADPAGTTGPEPTDTEADGSRTTALQAEETDRAIAADLNFREAQTALELSLAELQAADLDVEQMAGLYRRARCYADRCEQLLKQVEQEVMQWDPDQPQNQAQPYTA